MVPMHPFTSLLDRVALLGLRGLIVVGSLYVVVRTLILVAAWTRYRGEKNLASRGVPERVRVQVSPRNTP